MDVPLSLQVECRGGPQEESVPQRFTLGDRSLEVVEVLDRWLAPESRYFKLRADDGAVYILRHNVEEARWDLALYDSGARTETRLSST